MSSNNFLLKKSAIAVILILNEKGLSFNEIVRRTASTPVTASSRLKEFRDMGLITLGLIDDKRVYQLTEKGRKVIPFVQRIKRLLTQLDKILKNE